MQNTELERSQTNSNPIAQLVGTEAFVLQLGIDWIVPDVAITTVAQPDTKEDSSLV